MKRKVKSLLCLVLGHQYAEIMRLSLSSHLIGCKRCDRRWGMNTDAHALIPWDMELMDMHLQMGHFDELMGKKPRSSPR